MTLRAGVIGGGMIAAAHVRAIRASGNTVAGVASRTAASADAAALEYRTRPYRSVDELLASPDIDVVHICTPNRSHAGYALAALSAVKHVVCEKPLGINIDEARALQTAAASAGPRTAVPFVYRYHSAVREMRDRVRAGSEPFLARGAYLQDWLVERGETNWRVDDVQGGASRAFADIGVHLCDLVEFVTGQRITQLVATTSQAYATRDDVPVRTEDVASLLVRMDRGTTGVLTVSQVSHGHQNHLTLSIDSADAAYAFDQEEPDRLTVSTPQGSTVQFRGTRAFASVDAQRLSFLPPGHPQGYQDAFNAFLSDAYDSFTGLAPEGLPTFEDGYRSAVLTEAVLASARTGEWQNVEQLQMAQGPAA
ncbi:MAG: oxidoreductase domain protein [Naasia sp.]|nr:oxidoreductase domain protein [Naasia sp.]